MKVLQVIAIVSSLFAISSMPISANEPKSTDILMEMGLVKFELVKLNHDGNASEFKKIISYTQTLNEHFMHESGDSYGDSYSDIRLKVANVSKKNQIVDFNFDFTKRSVTYIANSKDPLTNLTELQFHIKYHNGKFTVIDRNPNDEFDFSISKVSS